MSQEKISLTEKDIWIYWRTLFPEVREEKKLEEMLSGRTDFKQEEVGSFFMQQNINYVEPQEQVGEFVWEAYCGKAWMTNSLFKTFRFVIAQEQEKAEELINYLKKTECVADIKEFLQSIFCQLCERLFEISMRTLILEINVMRKSGKLQGDTKEERYTYYTDTLWSDQTYIQQFYGEYAHLYSLQRYCTRNFLSYAKEVVVHTWKHQLEIADRLLGESIPFRLADLELGKGDTHKQGKTVSIVTLTGNKKVVYKPRSLKMEQGFDKFIQYINHKGAGRSQVLYEMKYLDYEQYGFLEFITAKECKDEEEVRNYYIRSGKLLAMLYALNAKDLHHENLIAHGAQPVVIDLEALFHSDLEYDREQEDYPAYGVASKRIGDSVYSIGLLPMPVSNPYNSGSDHIEIGGFGGEEEQISPFKVYMIKDKETDKIHLEKTNYYIQPQNNVPKYKGKPEVAVNYQPEIVQGFREVYECMKNNAEELTNLLGKWFQGAHGRIIYRATYLYAQLMFTSYHPDFMRERAHRYVLFHRLAYNMKQEEKLLLQSEVRDLMRDDVPYFEVDIASSVIKDSDGKEICFSFRESPLEAAQKKIENLGADDLKEQITIIRNAFGIKEMKEYQKIWETDTKWNKEAVCEIDYLPLAEKIGNYLIEKADKGVLTGKEDYCWIDFVPMGDNHINYQYIPLEADLYNGNSGIALFLLYLSKETGKQKFMDAACASLNSVIYQLRQIKEDSSYLIGPFNGLSGYIYVLSKFYQVTGEKKYYTLVTEALKLMDKIYHADVNYDMISGSAGAIKVLLSVEKLFTETSMKKMCEDLIQKLAVHLLDHAIKREDGSCVWTAGSSAGIYTGYAHGICGIEEALVSVYEKYPDTRIKDMLLNTRKYVEKQFNKEVGNWRTMMDMREVSNAWCHGAPGILYSRVRLLHILGKDKGYEKDVKYAIRSILKKGLGNHVCYCHGDIGNLEVLQYAAEQQQNQELIQLCKNTYAKMAHSFEQYITKNQVLSYGMMMGITGVGYSLLRRISKKVPSILWLE